MVHLRNDPALLAHFPYVSGGVSSRAVDGNTNMQWSGGSITHTVGRGGDWWRVDLGAVYHVYEVRYGAIGITQKPMVLLITKWVA